VWQACVGLWSDGESEFGEGRRELSLRVGTHLGLTPHPRSVLGQGSIPRDDIQVAATLGGRLAAVGLIPVHGARHDAHAFAASGLATLLADISAAADLGYVGVEGIEIVPVKRLPGEDLTTQAEFNTAFSKIRAAVEHAIAHLKTWQMLSEEGGRYRAPIEKYQSMLKAVIGLYFFVACE
jgi:DDE superfamily endonuclease